MSQDLVAENSVKTRNDKEGNKRNIPETEGFRVRKNLISHFTSFTADPRALVFNVSGNLESPKCTWIPQISEKTTGSSI